MNDLEESSLCDIGRELMLRDIKKGDYGFEFRGNKVVVYCNSKRGCEAMREFLYRALTPLMNEEHDKARGKK